MKSDWLMIEERSTRLIHGLDRYLAPRRGSFDTKLSIGSDFRLLWPRLEQAVSP